MKTGTKVKNTGTGELGHVIDDDFGCCDDTEILVVYDGTSHGMGTDKKLLEPFRGLTPNPDMEKCGAGQGADCCIFLTVGAKGPCCERFTSMRNTLLFRTMNAKRDPKESWPECMIF